MTILRKRGKEKLRFRIVDKRVNDREFGLFKRLILECLRENEDVERKLDSYYERIQIGFFCEKTTPIAHKSLKEFFKDRDFPSSVTSSSPAFAVSKNGLAYIGFYLRDLKHHFEERKSTQNAVNYYKNVAFEELCHLVEQRGSYGAHPYSDSWMTLLNLYDRNNKKRLGEEILLRLYRERGEHEVRLLMIEAYPKEWVKRFWEYFRVSPEEYKRQYDGWKQSIPTDVAHARLVTDTLSTIGLLDVAGKILRERLSKSQEQKLDNLLRAGKTDLENKRSLIEKSIGFDALRLVDTLDTSIFEANDAFFQSILSLWKSLGLV